MVLWYVPSAFSADALRTLHWKDQPKKCRSGVAWGCWPDTFTPSCAEAVGQLYLTILSSGWSSQRPWALLLGMQYENQYENQYKNLMDYGY